MWKSTLIGITLMASFSLISALADTKPAGAGGGGEAEFKTLRDAYLAKFKPLTIESETAWWEANTTGSDAAFAKRKKTQEQLVELHTDKAVFSQLKALKDGNQVQEPILKRELDVMHRTFLPGQANADLQKKIVALQTEVEQMFNAHRGEVDGKQLSENDIRQVLSDSADSKACEKAWKAYMDVGAKVDPKLKELLTLRNQMARELGFKNFFSMKMALQEIDENELVKLFEELDNLTKKHFASLKRDIDAARAARFGISSDQLRPWHFGDLFFQDAPDMGGPNLDDVYKNVDLLEMAKTYYAGVGTPVEDILARSDLYEKPGKSPHAFADNIDRDQDIRVLCNLKPNAYWADTLIHELGHAVYDKYIDKDVPFLLHEASHSITTEGYAMMMGAYVKKDEWLTKMLKVPPDQAAGLVEGAQKNLRAEKLIFSRWAQVMVGFERGMYSNPDQDLGVLWWDLKAKYQMLNPPESKSRPDYAAKVHIVTHPVYYHSYMMGELFAAQVQQHVTDNVAKEKDATKAVFVGRKEVGDYWKQRIFGPGNTRSWNELTKWATGKPLSPEAFAKQWLGNG